MRNANLLVAVVSLAFATACGTAEETDPEPPEFVVTLSNLSMAGDITLSDGTTTDWMFAPGVIVVHDAETSPFREGESASAGLEALAEEGDNGPLIAELRGATGVTTAISLAAEDQETYEDTALIPGGEAQALVSVVEGQRLSILMMFGHSNDVFVGTGPTGVEVLESGAAVADDITGELSFWDAGTEVNEEPGLGEHQPGVAPNSGPDEDGVVTRIEGEGPSGFEFPSPSDILEVRLELRER